MSLPRRLLPGQTHSVIRRAARRCFFLTPKPFVEQVVLYALGAAQLRYPKVDIHALMLESNHEHVSATDRHVAGEISQFPEFFGYFHMLVARALNAEYGRGENFWKSGSYDNVENHGQPSIEAQLLYLWTNPVRDGLVESPAAWPGVHFQPEDFGRTIVVRKPAGAFFGGRRAATSSKALDPVAPPWESALERQRSELLQGEREVRDEVRALARSRAGAGKPKKPRAPRPPRDRSTLPQEVTVTIKPPPGYEHLTLEEVRAHFRRLLDAEVERIREERRRAGKTRALGVEAVETQDPLVSAGDTFPSFARNPRVACKDRDLRIVVLLGLVTFRSEYRLQREAWSRSKRVVFPPGTYGMARLHGARVERPSALPRLTLGVAA